ncbi:hypothetical protein LCGC14_0651770 [marine sediment metagenome]|uniref:Uncharacterized protein n=1 Tax=marine sediment metagenome TaxID=412755 RepID=A0A0F9RFX4_9ZZZZ
MSRSIRKVNWTGAPFSNGKNYILYTILAYILVSMIFVLSFYKNV